MTLCDYMQHCFIKRYKRVSPLNSVSTMCDFINHSVANANHHLHILVLILPEVVIDCFEL